MYVSNDEAEQMAEADKIAAETVQQLEEMGVVEFDWRADLEKTLANIQPPTEDERNENRCTGLKLQLEDDENEPTKKSTTNSPKKNFSIFDKPTTRRALEPIHNTLTKKTHETKKTITAKDDESQMIIDAGQIDIAPTTCNLCGTLYHPGNAEDEKIHKIKHDAALGIISFKGWKNETNVGSFPDGRIIVVKSTDAKSHWEKAESVLEIVDRHLGFGAHSVRNKDSTKFYMFIDANRVVGYLVAERLNPKDVVSRASPRAKTNKQGQEWVLEDIPNPKVDIGISRLWVAQDYRRKNVATRLVKAMESSFQPGLILKKGQQYAFSHTTPDGTQFASKYVGLSSGCFLTYKQSEKNF